MINLAMVMVSSSVYGADDPASLDHLADIVCLPPVSWWPLAPGWYVVTGALLVLLIITAIAAFKYRQQNAYRRFALAELDQAGGGPNALTEISAILKRTALVIMPRRCVAALSAESWMQWLEQTAPGVIFSESSRQLLTEQIYRGEVVEDEQLAELLVTTRAWILKHRLHEPRKPAMNRP
jgi:hypothetical protein